MMSVLEEPAVRQRVAPISVETYHRLAELGHLSERTELIRGAVIEQMARTPLHTTSVGLLHSFLEKELPSGFHSRPQEPLTFPDSEPEPDIAVVVGKIEDYADAHPTTAQLVIEVAVSSEALDRVKLGLYAEARIPEYWLLLAEERILERHTGPRDGGYAHVERAVFPAQIPSTVFPGIVLPPPGLFRA